MPLRYMTSWRVTGGYAQPPFTGEKTGTDGLRHQPLVTEPTNAASRIPWRCGRLHVLLTVHRPASLKETKLYLIY